MLDFFTKTGGAPFYLFGKLHISLTVITLILVILIFCYRDFLKRHTDQKKVRFFFAFLLLANMIIYYAGLIYSGTFNALLDLPLHFCFITNFVLIYILLSGNQKWYKIIYFFTIVGPLPAMLFPDLTSTYNRYIFYQFIICHHCMVLASIYLLTVCKYKIERKDIVRAFIAGNILVLCVSIVNMIFKTNYIMIATLPAHIYTLFGFTKYLSPIFWLELVALISMAAAYIPVYLLKVSEKKKQQIES